MFAVIVNNWCTSSLKWLKIGLDQRKGAWCEWADREGSEEHRQGEDSNGKESMQDVLYYYIGLSCNCANCHHLLHCFLQKRMITHNYLSYLKYYKLLYLKLIIMIH